MFEDNINKNINQEINCNQSNIIDQSNNFVSDYFKRNSDYSDYLEKNYCFKSPIEYNFKTKSIDKNIIETLELVKSIDSNEVPIYQNIYPPFDIPTKINMEKSVSYYTTDSKYLKQTQQIIELIKPDEIISKSCDDIDSVLINYKNIKSDTGFYEKYNYFDFNHLKPLNNNSNALGFISIYNIASPIISLCMPLLILLLPIIILKINKIEFNLLNYINILKPIVQQSSIGKLFMNYNESNDTQKIYLFASAFFYFFSMYQNILSCIRFYSNIKKIHNYLFTFRNYLSNTILKMEYFYSLTKNFDTYINFNINMLKIKNSLNDVYLQLKEITEFNLSISKLCELGNIMKIFYQLYDDEVYTNCFLYSFGFNGYINNLVTIKDHVMDKKINKATFLNKKCNQNENKENENKENENKENENKQNENKQNENKIKMKIKNMYYPKFICNKKLNFNNLDPTFLESMINSKQKDNNNDIVNVITNDCDLDKNIILTGPNASGKTTFIKSLFINILLSQQIGYGCYDKLKFIPYDYFHCYLNIPDTSGRDSLFQAEARRCKNIIEFIDNANKNDTHFCIFDELYSGTNPDEAIISAEAFIKYISNYSNVSFLLTTHYTKLCKKLNNEKNKKKINKIDEIDETDDLNISNYHMKTLKNEITGDVNYTYKLKEGISKIKSGIQVLKNMNYPEKILLNLL